MAGSLRHAHKGKSADDRFIPITHQKIPRNKTECDRFCTTSQRANWSHPRESWCRTTMRSLAIPYRRNKMKNNLRMLGLGLCMLPMYLHAGTGQDLKQEHQPAQEQNTRSAEPIPAGTILPISLNSNLRSDKTGSGATIIATVMQDVPLGRGETLRKGSKVTGHVVETITPGNGSDESKISFQFDQVRFGNETLQITATLRAIASRTAVLAATPTKPSIDDNDEQVEIGGDQISYGEGGPVMVGSQVVGRYTSQGVLANGDQNSGTSRGATSDDDARPRALWLFSVNARGTYGFGDLRILQSGRTGEVTLASNRKVVEVDKGSAMLLRVNDAGPEEAHAHTSLSRGTWQ